jgi:hypothetical protein
VQGTADREISLMEKKLAVVQDLKESLMQKLLGGLIYEKA